ncbi:MAG TPA: hemolysin family protein [Ardenticatenaceae bacterium]|jgi:CBS domain containing-hemolysin-like protein
MITNILIIVGAVTLMIGITALYVAGEFATVSARKSRIIQLAEQDNHLAQVLLPVLEDPHKLDNFIAASQVGITLSSLVLGIYGQRQIAPLLEGLLARLPLASIPVIGERLAGGGAAAILVLFVLTLGSMVLGELVPKSLAIQYPERVALATALPMKWSTDYIFRPFIIIFNGSGQLILRLLGLSLGEGHTHIHSPEEIEILVGESVAGGLLDADERQLLHNAFRLGELTAGEVMIPRTRMTTAPVTLTVGDLLRLAAESSFTRIPLYEEDVDHIVGFVHLKDLFRLREEPQSGIHSILREVPYVPETMLAGEVWEMLNQERCYLAIVFDEYGGTAGMITQEDLIEELFGELQDEFDQEAELIAPDGEGHIIVRGDLLVSQFNELLRANLPTEVANTVGGLVLDELGRVPVVGDEAEIAGIHFRVEAVAGRSVRELSFTTPPNTEALLEQEGIS